MRQYRHINVIPEEEGVMGTVNTRWGTMPYYYIKDKSKKEYTPRNYKDETTTLPDIPVKPSS